MKTNNKIYDSLINDIKKIWGNDLTKSQNFFPSQELFSKILQTSCRNMQAFCEFNQYFAEEFINNDSIYQKFNAYSLQKSKSRSEPKKSIKLNSKTKLNTKTKPKANVKPKNNIAEPKANTNLQTSTNVKSSVKQKNTLKSKANLKKTSLKIVNN